MTYLSIVEKFKILFSLLLDYEYLFVFIGLLLVMTLFYSIKKISGKKYLLFMFLLLGIIFGISIINNYNVLSITFDNFANIFFGNIYFPSIYVYIGTLVIGFISFIVSMFSTMCKKIYKVMNGIMFIINNVLFVIILNIIAKNKIDIFSINSLYTNIFNISAFGLEYTNPLTNIGFLAKFTSFLLIYLTNIILYSLRNCSYIYTIRIK